MAVKLPDTLVPMADFPSAFAKDVQFTDGENLQDKLDKGKLGSSSSGTGLTEEQANNIEKIPSIEGIVTSNSQAIENKADKDHEHTEYLKEIPDEYVTDTELSTELDKKINKEVGKGLSTNDLTDELVIKINSSATETFVTNAIANAQLDGGDVDLSGYATVDALNLKADLTHTHDQYLTEIPDEYITEAELTDKNYADKEYVTQAVSNVNVDLTEYAKTSDIPTKVSQLTNDSNFITTIPEEYITETELANELSTRNVKTYTNITQLGLTAPVITGRIYNALPENSIFQCEITDNETVSDTPEATGILTIQKSSKRLAIEFKASARYSVYPNNLYLGQLKGDDGSGITWNKVALSSDLEGCVTDTELSSKGYATETFVTNKIAEASLSGSGVDLSGYATKDDVPTKTSELTNDSGFITSIPSIYITDTELETKGYLTEHQDISGLQTKTDNSLTTTDKTVTGAINEVNGNLLDTVGFSADYKNIILNRKSGLNPYTIPITAIIHNASLTELKDIDSTDVGNGKTLIYDSATQKHKYVDSTGTDEFVKMDSATDAKYLSDLIDKSTVVNDNGVLKVKKLDGQEVTITEINYLKGLTMNVMDLVNAFANGGVKVLNTPLNTASELDTMNRTSFIEGISYIVYVLADENHAGAKTTYLVNKTNTTFFGNADSQRNFTTNPIDLANEVTGKLDNSHIDVDSLWTLLTINDTYKTLTTNNEVFGTHGAKAMYDELTTEIGEKANTSDIPTKVSELTNDSNYQTAKQVNSAVTTAIAKVETELNENIEEKIGNIDNLKLIDSGGNVDANNCRIADRGIYGVYGYHGLFTQNVPMEGYAIIRCYHYGGGIRQFIDYTTANNTKTYTRLIQYDGNISTDWQELATMDKVRATSVADIPKTTLTPVFPGEVRVAPSGVAINYIVRNGWCNVNFEFNLASATTFSWTNIATGLPKPANNVNILLMDESGKINRTIAIKINSTGSVSSRIPVEFTAVDWWTGNISYPVAES